MVTNNNFKTKRVLNEFEAVSRGFYVKRYSDCRILGRHLHANGLMEHRNIITG